MLYIVGINLYTFSFAETNLGFACGSMLGKKFQKLFSQMVVQSGDLYNHVDLKQKDRQIQAINQWGSWEILGRVYHGFLGYLFT